MLSFDDVWAYTSTVDGWFGEEESRALFAAANQFQGTHFIEIGCWAGKSSSILIQVALANRCHVDLIDPFVWLEGDSWPAFQRNIIQHFPNDVFTLHKMGSVEARGRMPYEASVIHIDGDHSPLGVMKDCELYLPLLHSGGIVCAHDYDNPAYPDVREMLDRHTKGWDDLGVHNTLAVRRKP